MPSPPHPVGRAYNAEDPPASKPLTLVYSNWQRGLTQIQDVAGSNPAASTSKVNINVMNNKYTRKQILEAI